MSTAPHTYMYIGLLVVEGHIVPASCQVQETAIHAPLGCQDAETNSTGLKKSQMLIIFYFKHTNTEMKIKSKVLLY